jgi:hypothetical protein
MSFPTPSESGYTIYSKSSCRYSIKAKKLLTDYDLSIYICDSYLRNDREEFLDFIKQKAGKEHSAFPIIFKDAKYVGGYSDLLTLLRSELLRLIKDVYSPKD